MAGNNYRVTGDNLPKDSGNRYLMAWLDPVNNAFTLPWGFPVSGSAGGLVIGHAPVQYIADVITATGVHSSGVDLNGYTVRGLIIPQMGSGCNVRFQVSSSGLTWVALLNAAGVGISATGDNSQYYALGANGSPLVDVVPYGIVRMSATVNQTASRTALWVVST